MDMTYENNYIKLCGTAAAAPKYSHTGRGRQFFCFPLEIKRLSGNVDRVNIVLLREQLELLEAAGDEKLCITGQLRSFNNRRGEGAKLVITVLAKEIFPCCEQDENLVSLTGTICKHPKLRITPMGRDICDIMLAVNRHYGRSDYLPCICWGLKAREAAQWPVGTTLQLEGRLQSRNYIKISETGAEERVAFEVSVTRAERLTAVENRSL